MVCSIVICIRQMKRFDWILYVVPYAWFDFSMLTATDGDDLTMQVAELLGYNDVVDFATGIID